MFTLDSSAASNSSSFKEKSFSLWSHSSYTLENFSEGYISQDVDAT